MQKLARKYLPHATAIIVVVAAALTLRWMGRSWAAPDGTFGFWSGDVNIQFNSQRLFDLYTFTHVIHGLGFYALLRFAFPRIAISFRLSVAVFMESAWEVLENTPLIINRYREATFALGYFGDSIVNSMGDIFACIIGFALARRLPVWASILIFLAIETALLFVIRDSLLLNILLLVYPADSIRDWQLGG